MEGIVLLSLCVTMLSAACVLGMFVYNMAEQAKADRATRAEILDKLDRLTAPKEEKPGDKDPTKLFQEGLENILNFGIGGDRNGDD